MANHASVPWLTRAPSYGGRPSKYQFWRPRSGFGEKDYIDQEAGNSIKQKLLEIKLLFGFILMNLFI